MLVFHNTIILGSCSPVDSLYQLMQSAFNPALSKFMLGFSTFIPDYVHSSQFNPVDVCSSRCSFQDSVCIFCLQTSAPINLTTVPQVNTTMCYYKELYKSKVVKNHEKTVQVIFITSNSIFNTNGHGLWDSRIKKEQQNFYMTRL